MTDKNLFLYDLAVCSIMKNEAPYAKEWLDYHLLAGVNHFYLYDNDSPDNLKEVLQPYIDAGIVTYHFYPGKARQYEAYNDSAQNYKFFSRYMAFIDADEFIFPRNDKKIVETVDECLADKPQSGGLAVNIFGFGSNYHEKADYSKGVLERFTRRADENDCPIMENSGLHGGSAHVSTITDPRKINYFYNPHFAAYFEGYYAVNENGEIVPAFSSYPVSTQKIAMYHYPIKSREEYEKKVHRGTSDAYHNVYERIKFEHRSNEIFDDSIIKYRDKKLAETSIEILMSKQPDYNRIFSALIQNLIPVASKNFYPEFFAGKMETFLTGRAVAEKLRENVLDESTANFFEELSLKAIYRTLFTAMSISDMKLLIAELPKILPLKYPVVKDIRAVMIEIIPQLMNIYRVYDPMAWKEFVNLKYLTEMLKIM